MNKQVNCKKHNVLKKEIVDSVGKPAYVCPVCEEVKRLGIELKAREESRKVKIEHLKNEIKEIQEFAIKDKKNIEDRIKKLDKPKEEVKQ